MIREAMIAQTAPLDDPVRAPLERVVRAYLSSVDTGDVEARLALFAPDATLEDPVGGAVMAGHDALRAFWTAGAGLAVTTSLRWLAICGDEAAYRFDAELVAGDETVTIEVIETLRLGADGLIAAMRAYFDRGCIV